MDKLSLPPPVAHAVHDAVVLTMAREKFIVEVYNTKVPPTVAVSFALCSFTVNHSGIARTCISLS